MNIKLVQMTEADVDEVLEIEKRSFPSPWSRRLFLNELANPNSHLILARDYTNAIMGYVCFWIVADEAHILDVAVHPAFRRLGIGKMLLNHVVKFAGNRGASYFALEVRDKNEGAKEFYKKFGFRAVGVRKGYYADTGEDAILMEFELKEGEFHV